MIALSLEEKETDKLIGGRTEGKKGIKGSKGLEEKLTLLRLPSFLLLFVTVDNRLLLSQTASWPMRIYISTFLPFLHHYMHWPCLGSAYHGQWPFLCHIE